MTKSKEHPDAKVFKDIILALYQQYVEPYKGLKKAERPPIPVKVQERIDRNERFVKELNALV